MAKVFVAEFDKPPTFGAPLAVVPAPALAEQSVAIGGASVQSTAFGSTTKIIRVHTDAICSIKIGINPVATTDTMRLAANTTEYFFVLPGQKIAVITNT